MAEEEAVRRMARRLRKEFRPSTEHGDVVELHDFEAETLAEIIAEYVASVVRPLPSHEEGR